jgi:hypothetical protein
MPLFNDISTLKSVTGGAISATMELDSIEPYFQIAHERHIEAWLGTDLLTALETGLAAGSPAVKWTALAPYYRRALGWLTMYEYLSFATVQLGESGLHRVETDSHKTAYKYQEKAIRETALQNGYEALEKLLIYLEANQADYDEWELSPGYQLYHGVLLNTATAFRMVGGKKISRQVFEVVRGMITEVEELAIVPIIGQAQYDALLTARKTGTWTSETLEKKIILLAQRIAAHFTLVTALKQHIVALKGDAVVQLEAEADQSLPKEGAPTLAAVGIRLDSHDETANRYIKIMRTLLDANTEDPALVDYAAWLVTLAELEAAYQTAREATNAADALSYAYGCCHDLSERCDGGNAFGFGMGFGTTRKGASRI